MIARENGDDEMETKHTPGPWKVEKWIGLVNPLFIEGERNGESCIIAERLYDENNEPTLEEAEANASLIAAAPELLDACKLVIAEANRLIANGIAIERSAWKTINKLKAAIAKAEGNQQ